MLTSVKWIGRFLGESDSARRGDDDAEQSQSNPIHFCCLMQFKKPADRGGLVGEIVDAYRTARTTPPFDCVPEMAGTHTPRRDTRPE